MIYRKLLHGDTLKERLIALLVTIIFKSFAKSYRFLWPEGGHRERYIFALWHQNLVGCLSSKIHSPHISMVSRSKDGNIATAVSHNIGYVISRGSSSKGGVEAMENMLEAMRQHPLPAALTVDGPRGPIYQCKRGAVVLAKESQLPILPYIALAEKYWTFKSWDRFRLPKPFSKIVCLVGAEIMVPKDADNDAIAAIQQQVNQALMNLEQKAQSFFNRGNA